jgi:hypothetical protein
MVHLVYIHLELIALLNLRHKRYLLVKDIKPSIDRWSGLTSSPVLVCFRRTLIAEIDLTVISALHR